MTAPIWQTPERYVHGTAGPVVVVPGRIAAWLVDRCQLNRLRSQIRGQDSEVDAVLIGIALAATAWRTSATGSPSPAIPEVGARSDQWLSSTAAADLLGITDRAVRDAASKGRLRAQQVDGRWRITRTDIEHYRAARTAV